MVTKEAIDSALNAHAQWKKRLQDAVDTGKSEFKPEVVKKDNECQFGKWLYGFSPADMNSDDYRKVKELHAEFHKGAAEVLALALAGKKEEANKRLALGGLFGSATGKLVIALNGWKSKL